MDKEQLIIALFSNAPRVWDAEQLETIKRATGAQISIEQLETAYKANNSANIKHYILYLDNAIIKPFKARLWYPVYNYMLIPC